MVDMHELSIASELLQQVASKVEMVASVREVHLRLGKMSGINADSLLFGFEALAPTMGYENVKLHIEEMRSLIRCRMCNYEDTLDDFDQIRMPCPQCGNFDRSVNGGMECTLDHIILED